MKKLIQIMFLSTLWMLKPLYAESLNEFINTTIQFNPQIQAARANVQAAKARAEAAGNPLYNPVLTAEQQSADENTASIGINQTIDWANKRGARRGAGAANVLVAEAELSNLQQKMAATILSALASYQVQEKVVALAKERTDVLQQFVGLTKKRYKSGDIARVELDLAQLALSEALAQQASAEVARNEALQELRATTGFVQTNWPKLPNILPALSSTQTNIDDLMTKLPSVAVLNQQYFAALAEVKVAQKNRYADPTISVQGGQSSSQGQQERLIGVAVSMPLYIRNPYRAEVNAANFDANEMEGNRLDVIRQAKAEILSSKERYQTLYNASKQWDEMSDKPLTDGVVLLQRLWQAGEIGTSDYLFQLKQRIDSQIAGAQLTGQVWQAWAEWLRASGQINNWLSVLPS